MPGAGAGVLRYHSAGRGGEPGGVVAGAALHVEAKFVSAGPGSFRPKPRPPATIPRRRTITRFCGCPRRGRGSDRARLPDGGETSPPGQPRDLRPGFVLCVNQAHRILSDPLRRARYDAERTRVNAQPRFRIGSREFFQGLKGEQYRRQAILCLLYRKRIIDFRYPGMSTLDGERLTGDAGVASRPCGDCRAEYDSRPSDDRESCRRITRVRKGSGRRSTPRRRDNPTAQRRP